MKYFSQYIIFYGFFVVLFLWLICFVVVVLSDYPCLKVNGKPMVSPL